MIHGPIALEDTQDRGQANDHEGRQWRISDSTGVPAQIVHIGGKRPPWPVPTLRA
jgi:hypothetical protein